MVDGLAGDGEGGVGVRVGGGTPFYGLAQISGLGYVNGMTQAVAQILSEVDGLSRAEQSELRHLICERVPMSEDLTDEDSGALAAASFRALDEEEKGRA